MLSFNRGVGLVKGRNFFLTITGDVIIDSRGDIVPLEDEVEDNAFADNDGDDDDDEEDEEGPLFDLKELLLD